MKSLDCLDGVHGGCLGCACTCHPYPEPEITNAHGFMTLFGRVLPALLLIVFIIGLGLIVWAVKSR